MKRNVLKEQKNSVLTYKSYYGSIDFSLEDNCLYGSLIGLENGAMTYEGTTLIELKARFEETVDMYLEHCQECGIEPEKPFSGLFNIRLNPALHQKMAVRAREKGMSVHHFIKQAIERELYSGISI